MYMLEGVSRVQTSLLLMKSLNKTETPIFFVSQGIFFFTFILLDIQN